MWKRRALSPEDILIALPYLLLPAGMALTLFAQSLNPTPGNETGWWVARWAVRLLFVAGAYAGWRAGRPRWFYPWLGFAVYEVVATLLAGAGLLEGAWILLAGLFSLTPYFLTIFWIGRSQPQLASYTVLSQAGLAYPLLFFTLPEAFGSQGWFLVAGAGTSAIFLAFVAVYFWRNPPDFVRWQAHTWRWLLLYGGVAGSVFLQILLIVLREESGLLALFLVFPLAAAGWLILSFPPLLALARRIFEREMAPPLFARFAFWRQLSQLLGQRPGWLSRPTFPAIFDTPAYPSIPSGGSPMSENSQENSRPPAAAPVSPGLERAYKTSVAVLTGLVLLTILLYVGRSAVYKIHEFERGLHLRGGRFVGVQLPGWHMQIPLVDTVIVVKVNERLGYVERIPAMTSDNVTMNVSLQFTYRVTEPERFALAVDDPERIVFEFVQGKLRDVINTKAMAAVMNQRAVMNQEVMGALKDKEQQYGVQFITVQMQNASPPDEVLTAIKDRMVAVQRQEQAQAEAAQRRTLADADFYTAQKEAEANAYQITTSAAAEAERTRLNTESQQLSLRAMLAELEGTGTIGEKYIDLLIAQALKENSKWIIGGDGSPLVDVRGLGE